MKDWWDFIHPYGLVEFRFIKNGTVIDRKWTAYPDRPRTYDVDVDTDVYYGVLPRMVYGGGKSEDCWPTAHVLWADLDAKDFCVDPVLHEPESKLVGAWEDDKSKALEAALRFPLTPSAIIDSGHGYHLYWRLNEPVEFKDAEYAMRGIAKWVNGDSTYDQARILRVPGTTNWKDPKSPVPVRLLKLDTLRRYDLSDFAEMTACLEKLERQQTQSERRQDAPDWLREALNNEPPKGTRSEEEFRLGIWLGRYGYTDEQILDALLNMPFGAKAQERGERWAEGEVARIRRQV